MMSGVMMRCSDFIWQPKALIGYAKHIRQGGNLPRYS